MLRRVMMAASSAGADPLFSSVKALCKFEAAEGVGAWSDIIVPAGWASVGAGHIQASAAKFGATGLACNTGGGGRFPWTTAIGTDDYCVEHWYRPYTASGNRQIIDMRGGASPLGLSIFRAGTNLRLQLATVTNGTIPLVLGEWHHICAERVAGVVSLYVDGVLCASAADVRNYTGTGFFYLGSTYNTGQLDVADYDEFRLTVGAHRYGGAFVPPSTPFPTS